MADSFTTLAELATINDANLADLEISDLLDDAPLLKRLAADIASNGTSHKYVKEVTAPVVGFRDVNDGRDNSKSGDSAVTIALKILDGSFAVDAALASEYSKGADAYVAREAKRHLKAAFAAAELQLLYGTGQAADGFVGLADAVGLDALADEMVLDATGTTADVGSSVFLIRTNDDGTDCTLITGQNGNIEIGDTVTQRIPGATGTYPGLYTPITGWLGLQIGGARSVGRIVNVTTDAGKGLTDDLIYDALALFPASRQPNLIVTGRRGLKQLRKSRTATNATGVPAPRPTEVDGIDIITTDHISVTEALVA
jgi:hypothetical protein